MSTDERLQEGAGRSASPACAWLLAVATLLGKSGRFRGDIKGKGYTAAATSAAYSPDGKRLATASDDGTVKFWDMRGKATPSSD